ncbi:unnamed protein product [Mytilus edulis]|uniref:Uncharacterized protein n=1 Tax=Mytilus edulis TaxID=6550 RepID=A0A8S3VJQ2_MYTED|nr:unnamed protein product [Mytilus edulis]
MHFKPELKIADFPQLAEVLELSLGERSKIHPRLENDTSFRGVKDNNIFDDEDQLKHFLKLSELGKTDCQSDFLVKDCPLLTNICQTWNLQHNFAGSYIEDYNHLSNSVSDNVRTAWLTEYSATIFSKCPRTQVNRYVKEPMPALLLCCVGLKAINYMCFES